MERIVFVLLSFLALKVYGQHNPELKQLASAQLRDDFDLCALAI
ncbi:hypothetical protein [Pedobacter sp. UC225_65]